MPTFHIYVSRFFANSDLFAANVGVAEAQEDAVEDGHEAEDEEEEEEVAHLRQQVRFVAVGVVRRVELVQTILVGLILSLSVSEYSDESTRGNGHKIEI